MQILSVSKHALTGVEGVSVASSWLGGAAIAAIKKAMHGWLRISKAIVGSCPHKGATRAGFLVSKTA